MLPATTISHHFTQEKDAAILRTSMAELVAQADRQLLSAEFFLQAARSALYTRRWRAAGAAPDQLSGRGGLRRLPFISGADLISLADSSASLRRGLLTRPRAWVTSRGESGTKKWLPLALADVGRWFGRVARLDALFADGQDNAGTTVLAINRPMPFVDNAVPYLWERADQLVGCSRLEFIVGAMSMLPRNHWGHFAMRKEPQWLMASVEDAGAFSTAIAQMAAPASLRRGFFWGAALDGPRGVRADLERSFGHLEMSSLYFSAECREMYAECSAHDGLHVWMDDAVHEIIPDGGGPEANEPVETVFLEEAAPGVEGEYVVTLPGEALPLIRYRTGDRVRVVSTTACRCGITHPRVLFMA